MLTNKQIRKRIIEKGNELGFGHFASSMSCVDACAFLYYHVMDENDIFIMSKGHGIISVLPILEDMGKNVNWKPYLDYDPEMGIQATTGSLGHGLPIALGRAFAKKIKGEPGKVYVMIGDGEIQEGSNWEALEIAYKLKINNLVILIDWNKYQAVSSIKEIMSVDEKIMTERLSAFGCDVLTINGHEDDGLSQLNKHKDNQGKVQVFILDTIKGKGIKFLEENQSFHVIYWHERKAEYDETIKELS